jgi:release factor glutamine methyltransferase
MTLRAAIAESSTDIAPRDAETLLAHILQRDRAWLLAHIDDPLSAEHLEQLCTLTARRAAHEPLQHLTGEQEFFGLNLRVTANTLIPRPETERLVESVIDWIANSPADSRALKILDVGTGTGAIVLALAQHLPTAYLTAVDLSPAALAVARENATRHHLDQRIRFVESDLLAAFSGKTPGEPFDIIVSNPPYVSLADAPALAPEVRDHEPHLALFAGNDGLEIYRRLIPQAHAALVPGGLLALEIGFGQSNAIRALLDPNLWHNIRILSDYAAIPRVVLAERN